MKTRISASVGAIGLAFSLYSQISNAYILDFDNCNGNTFSHSWVPGNVTFTYLENTRPAGALNLQPALNRAVDTINNSIELNINLTLNVDNTTNAIVTTQADGNQIGYSATLLGANTLAAEFSSVFLDCTTSQFSARFAESDIVYNSNLAYTDNNHTGIDPTPGGSNPANGAPYDAELLSVHELGHSLGLKHSNTILSTMNRFWPNSGNVSRQNLSLFQTDDLKGLRISYRTPDNRINLVASKYKNFFGEKADVNKVKRADTNARTDILTRGNAYYVDYTIANHSADSNSQSNVRVGVYLSTNDTISQFDTFLGSTTLTNMFNKTYSSTLWVQIPNTVATGTYFLGYMVDDQTNIAEINEQDNNVTLLNSQAGTSFTVN